MNQKNLSAAVKEKASSFRALPFAKSLIITLLGNALYAFSVALFLLPADLVTGGTTGIALLVHHLTGMPISLFVLLFNVAMLLLGWWILGLKFAVTTIVSTFSYPLFLELFTRLIHGFVISTNALLCAIFAGLGIGISLGLVIRQGASTGGMDIPPLVLNKLFKIPVSLSLNAFDVIILLTQLIYHPAEDILYGILLVLIYSLVLDKLLLAGESRTQLMIVSKEGDRIRQAILSEVDRGVTIVNGNGGYTGQAVDIVVSVISNRQLARVEKIVRSIDPVAFMVVNKVTEVSGRGFTLEKKYPKKTQP